MRLFLSDPPKKTRKGAPFAGSSLGPVSHTERPSEEPPAVPDDFSPARRGPGGRRNRTVALVAGLVSGLVLAGAFVSSNVPTHRLEIVSGRAAPKKTETGATERWRTKQVQVVIDGSIDAAGPGARDAVTEAFGAWLSSPALRPHVTLH